MFMLSWESYPFIMLCVALPMAAFYVVERRRERREEAAYDGPCMAHVGTDRGTELWCWQKSGHSGAHDEYPDDTPFSAAEGLRRLLGCPLDGCLFDLGHDGPHMCGVLPVGHEEDHASLPEDDERFTQKDAAGNVVIDDSPNMLPDPAPEAPSLCTWGEDGGGNDAACWKVAGHAGPHMVQDTYRD